MTRHRVWAAGMVLGALVVALASTRNPVAAQTAATTSLSGTVRSAAEGAMEGVVVIAQREGSPILTSVTTDATGQYRFPRNRLLAGTYTINIRAAGYVLPDSGTASVGVGPHAPATLDLKLNQATTEQLARHLTPTDWLNSMPGTTAQKDLLARPVARCIHCHDLWPIMRSRYTADEWLPVIQRMATYAIDNSTACGIRSVFVCDYTTPGVAQVSSAPRPLEGLAWYGSDAKALAQYLASVNLSGGKKTWDYALKTMPRPKGKATRLLVTVYRVPRQPSNIHDLTVDNKSRVWFGHSSHDYLGMFDPSTGEFREYPSPNYRGPGPGGRAPIAGIQDVEVDTHGNIWAGMRGGKMVYFDTQTEQWVDFDMPGGAHLFLVSSHEGQTETTWTTGRSPQPGGGSSRLTAYRLNYKTGTVEASFPMVDRSAPDSSGPRYCYQIDRDPNDNFLCADIYGSNIITVDAETGKTRVYRTPTPNAGPRRGRTDEQGRFWFGEFFADQVGLFDPQTESIQEFPLSTKYMAPYAAAPAKNGEAWVSSYGSDRLMRVDPKTGEVTEYLMPVYYDARKVVIDPSTSATTIWLPNKNLGQLIRVEPLD